MTRYAQEARVLYLEEPVFDREAPELRVVEVEGGVRVFTPHLPASASRHADDQLQGALIRRLLRREGVRAPIGWLCTPMARPLVKAVGASLVVYDCMDELSGFVGAPPALLDEERALFDRADVVFAGGHSLYQAKRAWHRNVHDFPSSVDAEHFRRARSPRPREKTSRPRVGFFGVIDERLDVALLDRLAVARPDLDFVLVGPVPTIDPSVLPRRPNLRYAGPRPYAELPDAIATWDVAMMPFARSEATRFISPPQTLEYMAAGKPVVSTSIRDVVRPYGESGLVRIADTPAAFAAAIDAALAESDARRLASFDAFLASTSWDRTWQRMRALLQAGLVARERCGREERHAESA